MNRRQRRANGALGKRKISTTHGALPIKLKRLQGEISSITTDVDRKTDEFIELLAEITNELSPQDDEGKADGKIREYAWKAIEGAVSDKLRASLIQRGRRKEDAPLAAEAGLITKDPFDGVTAETVDERLCELVVDRATLKRDLLFLLSMVDRCAVDGDTWATLTANMYEGNDGPYALSKQGAAALQEAAVRRKWRGCTAETFEATFDGAVFGRRQDRLEADYKLDVVLEDEMKKFPQKEQEEIYQRFKRRLEEEYLAITHGPDVARTAGEVADVLETVHPSKRLVLLNEVQARLSSPVKRDVSPGWFERELMLWGTRVWQDTYAIGLGLATARIEAERLANEYMPEGAPDDAITQTTFLFNFGAAWAVHAFQRLTTSHTFAAALMCSDANEEAIASIEKQWKAFLVMVPNGMLPAGESEISRILVATYEDCAEMYLVQLSPSRPGSHQTSMERGETLAKLLTTDPADEMYGEMEEGPVGREIFTMAKRLVAGLLLSLQEKENFREKQVAAKYSKGRKGPDEPAHRVVIVGRPLEVDCRESVRQYLKGKPRKGHHTPPSVTTLVRGHYRRQVVGIGRMFRKTIWIMPFYRNVIEGMPILTRPKAVQ